MIYKYLHIQSYIILKNLQMQDRNKLNKMQVFSLYYFIFQRFL